MKFRAILDVSKDFITYMDMGSKKYIDLSACRNNFRLAVNTSPKVYPFFAGQNFPKKEDFPYVGTIERDPLHARYTICFHNLERTTFAETGGFLNRLFHPHYPPLALKNALEADGWRLFEIKKDSDAQPKPVESTHSENT